MRTQAEMLSRHPEVTKTRGARRIVACQRKESSSVKKCQDCKKPIKVEDLYWAFGLRATTLNEKFHARKGCVWYYYCEACK